MHLKTSVRSLRACVALATLTVSPLLGASLTGGSANFNFHPAAWAGVAGGANSPGFEALKLNEVFNQAAANARVRDLQATLAPAGADESRLDEALARVAASLTTGRSP